LELARRVAHRHLYGSGSVRIVVDVPATMALRDKYPAFDTTVVGEFAGSASLYRVFDGEELERILASGRITGGQYSVKPEREYGASWGSNLTDVIRGMSSQRGRLGENLYLAKLDPHGKQFSHLGPELDFDPEGPPKQPMTMPVSVCSLGLGCSVADVRVNDVDFFRVEVDQKLTPLRLGDLKKELKGIEKELRPSLREPIRDSSWGLQPKDKLVVEKGSRKLGVDKGYPAHVKDVWQKPGEREVGVKLWFPYPLGFGRFKNKHELTLYATHPNRLKDLYIRLMDSHGSKIEVRRK